MSEKLKNAKIPDLNQLFLNTIEKKFEEKYPSKPGRQRTRNPNERAALKRWEKERSGKKIGEI